ncbi:MAG: hypothetical protein ACPGQL_02000 [Thermoplasmatota archaeon]
MHKLSLLLLPLVALSGCLEDAREAVDDAFDGVRDLADCGLDDLVDDEGRITYWFGPGYSLSTEAPAGDGGEPGNAFVSAFLTDDVVPWLSEPLGEGVHLTGDVILEYWARNEGDVAPVIIGGDPGEGYHFFNQFGSDVSFQPAYAVEYNDAVPAPGRVDHYINTLSLPPGGFVIEKGDSVRVLLTGLVLEGTDMAGHTILYGGETASRVSFEASCYASRSWEEVAKEVTGVSLPLHQGLLTGAVPATEGVNQATVPFDLLKETERLTISLTQTGDVNPVKDDLDMVVTDVDGNQVWDGGSPYADEQVRLWAENLEAAGLAPGRYQVLVNSYSGHAYTGEVQVLQEQRA